MNGYNNSIRVIVLVIPVIEVRILKLSIDTLLYVEPKVHAIPENVNEKKKINSFFMRQHESFGKM